MESEERYRELAAKWLDNTINSDERVEFARWYNEGQDNRVTFSENFAIDEHDLKQRISLAVDKSISRSRNRRIARQLSRYSGIAAIFLLIVSSGIYFYHSLSGRSDSLAVQIGQYDNNDLARTERGIAESSISLSTTLIAENDISPGGDKAILTLGDGSKIVLDDVQEGVVANQDGNSILKTADGELIYRFLGEDVPVLQTDGELVSFNTIETPKGGKFEVVLPDGSKVWLNAASSLRFPAAFNGKMRQVELTGEAYFEVASDKSRTFEVITRDQRVEVLGTHFNINAYADEPSVNTTLLEGSVQISDLRTNNSKLLKPGEQAQLGEKMEVVNIGNTSEAVAWKEGYFQFNDSDIQAVMRQIERWYDVHVSYETGFKPVQRFGGEIERSLSLVQVLKILEKSKVHFRIEGREVIVM